MENVRHANEMLIKSNAGPARKDSLIAHLLAMERSKGIEGVEMVKAEEAEGMRGMRAHGGGPPYSVSVASIGGRGEALHRDPTSVFDRAHRGDEKGGDVRDWGSVFGDSSARAPPLVGGVNGNACATKAPPTTATTSQADGGRRMSAVKVGGSSISDDTLTRGSSSTESGVLKRVSHTNTPRREAITATNTTSTRDLSGNTCNVPPKALAPQREGWAGGTYMDYLAAKAKINGTQKRQQNQSTHRAQSPASRSVREGRTFPPVPLIAHSDDQCQSNRDSAGLVPRQFGCKAHNDEENGFNNFLYSGSSSSFSSPRGGKVERSVSRCSTLSSMTATTTVSTRSSRCVNNDHILRKLDDLKAQVAEREEESRQEEARSAFFRSKHIDEVVELCHGLHSRLKKELTSRREDSDVRTLQRISDLTDHANGSLQRKVGDTLDLLIDDLQTKLTELNTRTETLFAGVRALADESNKTVAKFCGDEAEESIRRRDILADLLLSVGSESEARISMEAALAQDAQKKISELSAQIDALGRAREAQIGASAKARAHALGVSVFSSAMEGEGAELLLAPDRPAASVEGLVERGIKGHGHDASTMSTLPDRSTVREISEMKAMISRLHQLVLEEKRERIGNQTALRAAISDAEAKVKGNALR